VLNYTTQFCASGQILINQIIFCINGRFLRILLRIVQPGHSAPSSNSPDPATIRCVVRRNAEVMIIFV